jgi:hypothetical protein
MATGGARHSSTARRCCALVVLERRLGVCSPERKPYREVIAMAESRLLGHSGVSLFLDVWPNNLRVVFLNPE